MPSTSRLGSDSAHEVSYNGDEDDDEEVEEEVIEEEDEMMVGEEGGVDEVVEEEEQMEGGDEDGEEEEEVEVYEEDEEEEEVEDEDEMVVGEEDGVEEVDNELEEEEEQVKGGKEDGEEDEVEVEEEDQVEVEEEEEEEQVKGGNEDGEEDEAEVEEEEEEEQVKGGKEDSEEDEVEVEEEDEVEVEEEEEEQMKGGDGDNEEDEVEEEEVEVKGEEEVEEEEEDRGDGRKEGTVLPSKVEMGKEVEEEDEMKGIEEEGNEEGEDEVVEEQGDEQMKGCKEDAEEDEDQEQVDGGKGGDVLPNKDEMDTSEKIEPQELGEGPKSVSCTPVRFNSNQTPLTNGGNGGNVTSSDPSDEADSGAQLGKETTAEASKDSKEAHDSQVYLVLGDSMAGKNTKSYHEKDIAVESKNVKCDDVIEKEAPNLHSKMVLQTQEVLSLSSVRTPQRRPRSSSSDATIENANKRPGIICDFFARGWCIKGNSCRFLHQKEGFLITNQRAEELAGTSRNGNFLYPGSREISQEIVDSSNTESLSKSPLTLQRALVRAYGGEGHGLPKFHNAYDMHEAHPQSGKASYPRIDEFRQTLVREEYERPLGKIPPFDTLLERRPADYDSLSRRYPNEDKLFAEMPRWDSLNGSSLTIGSPLRRNTLVPEYGYSGGSSTASSLHQNCNYPHAYDRKRDDTSIQNQQIHIPFNDSYKSYSLSSSLTSGFSNLLNAEHLDTRMMSDFDRGNYGSRSASLPKNSSPYYTRSEAHNTAQHEDPRDLAALAGKTTKVQHAWAPSLSFRPSFCHEPANISSYGNQYDPLLDSIELPKTSSITFQNSQHMNGGPILSETHSHAQEPPNAFPQSHEAILNKSISPHGLSGFNSVDGGNIFMPKEDKHWMPDHAVDDANVNEADPGGNMRNIEEKGRNNKDSRALKFFHAALVDFVKELVKPSWREGHLSKDAHKMVVKKAVEKVLSAIQPHQVPTTTESVNQYFSTSRPKLLKLVEGYVVKYTKSGAS